MTKRSAFATTLTIAALAGVATVALQAMPLRDSGAPTPARPLATAPAMRIVYPADRRPSLPMPDGTQEEVGSVLNITRPMRYGDYRWDEDGVPAGRLWARVDLQRQIISVFRGRDEIGSAVILYGAEDKPTPPGVYPILERARSHRSTLYEADMPYMLRLTGDGVAVHASRVRAAAATHGCIGVPMAFARKLFDQARVGDRIAIVGA